MIFIDNLVEALAASCSQAITIDEPLLPSDGTDVSIRDLVTILATSMERKPNILDVPHWILAAGGKLIGKSNMVRSLFEPLRVDSRATCDALKWKPRVPVRQALELTAKAFPVRHSLAHN